MSKHTPGPWKVETQGNKEKSVYIKFAENKPGMGQPIAECLSPDIYANARLIAAAPDLLEFAHAMRIYFEYNPAGYEELRKICLAAIAKAEGKE